MIWLYLNLLRVRKVYVSMRLLILPGVVASGITLILATYGVHAQLPTPPEGPTRSSSGQFVVYGNPQPGPIPTELLRLAPTNFVRLTPNLAAIACERIKQALLWHLGAPDRWQGKIYVVIRPATSMGQIIGINSTKYAGKWIYQIDIPDVIDPERFARAVVQVLLLEWVNRPGADPQVFPPSWLSEGLAELILANTVVEQLVPGSALDPQFSIPLTALIRQGPKPHLLARAHAYFTTHRALTLSELVTPQPTNLLGDDALAFRYSAEMLVHELLQLKGGSAAMCMFLDRLAYYSDAPTALLACYSSHFSSLRDMEQWWLLKTSVFTARDLHARYPLPEAVRKVREILTVQIEEQQATNSPARWRVVPMQSVLIEWTNKPATDLVLFKISQLEALKLRAPIELTPLLQQYQDCLKSMLSKMERELAANAKDPAAARTALARVARATAQQLDALDAKLASLLPTADSQSSKTQAQR